MNLQRRAMNLNKPGSTRCSLPPFAAPRLAFTLVELLVAISIMTILAGAFLGALGQASARAKEIHTQALINRLNVQIMSRWESYRNRRLMIDPRQVINLNSTVTTDFDDTNPARNAPQNQALVRLRALRELMRMEMPDRYKDLHRSFDPQALRVGTMAIRPALWHTYRERIRLVAQAKLGATVNDTQLDTFLVDATSSGIAYNYQSAECLYLIVTTSTSEDDFGAEQQSQADIGDADGDGMFEFIDSWGRPIEFLRWAPGFISDVQPTFPDLVNDRDPTNHHDPLDTRLVDIQFAVSTATEVSVWNADPGATGSKNSICVQNSKSYFRGFTLTPLIYSAGVDREPGLFVFDRLDNAKVNTTADAKRLLAENDPYAVFLDNDSSVFYQLGEEMPGNAAGDNIHNHLLSTR